MTNLLPVTPTTSLDAGRASAPQDILSLQESNGKSLEQQLGAEFSALLAQMVLGAAVQVPIAVSGGIGVAPDAKNSTEQMSGNQSQPAVDTSAALLFGSSTPPALQVQPPVVQERAQHDRPKEATEISLQPLSGIVMEEGTEQVDKTQTEAIKSQQGKNFSGEVINNKGAISLEGFSPIVAIHDDVKARSPKQEIVPPAKSLTMNVAENVEPQQNIGVPETQSSQISPKVVNPARTSEHRPSETKVVEPVTTVAQGTAPSTDVKKDIPKIAQPIPQPVVKPEQKIQKDEQDDAEQGIQNKPTATTKSSDLSPLRDAPVKPVSTPQGGRGAYQQLAQTPPNHLSAKSAEQLNMQVSAPLTPELSKSVIDQIARELTFRIKDNVSEVRVSLKPESLGEVVVNMQMEESKITAQIKVDQPNVKTAVESQLPQLRQTLAERGIEIHRIDVVVADQSLARESRDQQSGKPKKRSAEGFIGIEERDSSYAPRSLGYNTIELLI